MQIPEKEMSAGEGKTTYPILIVEDSPTSREFLKMSLSRAGYTVTAAENGFAALSLMQRIYFPIVITDLMMPGMGGLELCRTIRNRVFNSYIYFIILTSKDSKEDIVAGLEAGADDYLTKPFHPAELIARLRTARRILELESSLKERIEEIRLLSVTDQLTRVYNIGYLNNQLMHEMKRSQRYHHSLSVIMCDIDNFKQVNDTYGHTSGDLVLKRFAQCLKESLRDGIDWVVRYGGEEFLIIMPQTNLQGAAVAAERLRQRVAELVFLVKEQEIRITASFGISGFDSSGVLCETSPILLIEEADRCLYKAKREGKNRVNRSERIASMNQRTCTERNKPS